MSKKAVQKMSGVLASVFAHHGHISREEAKEIDDFMKEFGDKVFM